MVDQIIITGNFTKSTVTNSDLKLMVWPKLDTYYTGLNVQSINISTGNNQKITFNTEALFGKQYIGFALAGKDSIVDMTRCVLREK